jgi:Tfp pilus assembly protein PilP
MSTLLLALMVAVQASAAAPATSAPATSAPAPASQPAPAAPTTAPQAPAAAPPAPAPSPSQQPPPPDNYTYSADGRRDPFMSLLGTGPDRGATPTKRGEGVAGMTLAEISVRGVLQSRGNLIAMVQGPDNRTYLVRQGDRLADGTVQSVTAEGLVVMQEVNDPLSLVKQRIVRKPLRSLEDVKQ